MSRARDIANLIGHTSASSGVHGATGAVVGTNDTQTLTNKTLSAPLVNIAFNEQSASYTLALSDVGKCIFMNSTSATTLTLPTNAMAPIPVGSLIYLLQLNTGQVTIAAASGAFVVSTPGLKTRARYSLVTFIKTNSNDWVASGDLTP